MIQFAKLDEYFDHDSEDIKSFLEIVVQDWLVLRQDILAAVANVDERQYSDATHKMISVLRLTEAHELQEALQQLRATFKTNDLVAMQQQAPLTIDLFDRVLQAMQERIAAAN